MPKIRLAAGKQFDSNKFELDGFIRLYVDYYLFLETDLVLHQSISAPVENQFDPRTNNAQAQTTYETYLKPFNFKQKRRMKSDEIHYIDHPLVGMILQVRKLDHD